jgi:hypothetical protein
VKTSKLKKKFTTSKQFFLPQSSNLRFFTKMHSNVLESKIQLFSNHTGKNNNFSNIISQVPDRHRHHHGEPIIPGPCLLPSQNNDIESPTDSTTSTLTEQQAHVRVSGTDIRPKEIILVSLALLLLIFSVALFFKHWRKNYWDINQLPYYAYLYKVIRIDISNINCKF